MISELSLQKFKAFSNLEYLRIAPITILSGVNSSGKSSILHSLLILKQSLAGELPEEAIQLDGKYLQYTQLREISYGLPRESIASVKYSLKIDDKEGFVGDLSFEIRNRRLQGNSDRSGPVVTMLEWKGKDDKKATKILLRKDGYRKPRRLAIDVPFLPKGLFETTQAFIKFEHFLPKYIENNVTFRKNVKNDLPEKATLKIPIEVCSSSLPIMINLLTEDLKRMKYLGPSRAIPRRAYIHYSDKHYDLDDDGGNAAHIFWLRQNDEVAWKGGHATLKQATAECLSIMGLTQQVTPHRSSRIVYQLFLETLSNPKQKVTIADVGFGYSQLLPIILRGLLSEKNALLLFEQPEIHLHPSAASKLADLFIIFMETGKRLIIETHSTELINKLQLHVIQDVNLKNKINVVFISPDNKLNDGKTQVRQLVLREDGMFNEWPDGFCDESEHIARTILELNAKRKK